MKHILKWITLASFALLLLTACGAKDEPTSSSTTDKEKDGPLKVVSSFTIIQDIVREIGGDQVEVYNLVPTGTDPHEYEPLPEDIKAATDADILFYNGLNLEGGDKGWFHKLTDAVGQKDENIFLLTDKVKPMYLPGENGKKEQINPHAFIDPGVGILMAEAVRDALVKVDPDHKDVYEKNATTYLERLNELDQEYATKIAEIPEENRTLVTSERAFQYMTKHYGLKEAFIWEIDTEENGSPEQITSLIKYIKENNVPILFVESNVDTRPMETVSKESGVKLFDKVIYSDEIGKPGDEVDTYMKYLTYNIKIIHDGLMGK